VAAASLDRNFITADKNPESIAVIKERLAAAQISFEVIELGD
jgi:DNA modification methylase